nr:hypothetical protein [Tanacetum cinerariifolium]
MERMEGRLGQFVDQLTNQMNDLMNNMRPRNRRRDDEDEELEENPFGDGSSYDEQSVVRPRRNQRKDNGRWESELFEFKEVPENKRVSLITTKLCRRASVWWQQMKLTRERVGKSKITSWQKMKKCMRANFIPHNYQRLMYQQLQNLKQGSKSVEDYTTEFYQLIARNDIQESEDQLVSRYIGGLRVQIMDSVNMFDPMTLSDAFQRALAFEKHNRRVGSSSYPAITGVSGSGNAVSRFAPNQAKASGGITGPVPKATDSSGLKCFNCGEPGHRQSECKKAKKRHLFADPEENDDDVTYGDYEAASVYDDEPEFEKEHVFGDVGVNLVVRHSCLTPKVDGTTYKDNVWCDVVAMDACHLLLGKPWEYDRDITHNGKINTYSFLFGGVKITLMPNKPKEVVNKPIGTLLTLSQFKDELKIVEKMNSNAYRLKLPSHIRCSDVFNVKHLLPYHGDSSDEDSVENSRTNFVYPGGNDVNPSIEEWADLFLEAQERVRKRGLLKWA